jgi:ligand-binding sensor protein
MERYISEIIDLPALQKLMESLYKATGINHALIDNDSKVLTAVGWQKICTDFHRVNPDTRARCQESDKYILNHLNDGPYVGYKCPNGLFDYCTPVIINCEHVANIFTGQMFHHTPDMEFFRRQAEEFGFDEKSYLDAVAKVNIFPEERMPAVMAFLTNLASMLGDMGLLLLKQKEIEKELEKKVAERTVKLQKSLEEIKTLRGILPLCSFCKKVRNDQGYWEQVDIYIRKYSEADISHSICPECIKKHYPDINIE